MVEVTVGEAIDRAREIYDRIRRATDDGSSPITDVELQALQHELVRDCLPSILHAFAGAEQSGPYLVRTQTGSNDMTYDFANLREALTFLLTIALEQEIDEAAIPLLLEPS